MFSDEFATKIRPRLVAYASSKGVPGDDVAQETLVVLWTKYSHLDSEADLVPLAFSICSRKIHEARRLMLRSGAELPPDLPSAQAAPEQRLIDIEVRDRLKRAVLNLSRQCKELLRLRLLGRSTAEIARTLNTRPATTHVWKHRCLRALMKEFS